MLGGVWSPAYCWAVTAERGDNYSRRIASYVGEKEGLSFFRFPLKGKKKVPAVDSCGSKKGLEPCEVYKDLQ